MEQWTAFVVATGIISFTAMISSIFKSINKIQPVPGIPDIPTNKWDVIDEELIRLHDDLSSQDGEEARALLNEISKLNEALAQKGE